MVVIGGTEEYEGVDCDVFDVAQGCEVEGW
jgi:hypothetical protein